MIYVASCDNEAPADEFRRPTAKERMELGQVITNIPRCIGFVHGPGTLYYLFARSIDLANIENMLPSASS